MVMTSCKSALADIIGGFDELRERERESHGLKLNRGKTIFLTDEKEMRDIEEMRGIKKVTETKYLDI
jgi:hypothetical protein